MLRSMNAPGSPSSALQKYVLLVALGLAGKLPLEPGGKTGAAAAAQAALHHLFDYGLGRHLGERLGQSHIAVVGYVLVYLFSRYAPLVAQHAQVLAGEEGDVFEQRYTSLGSGILVHKPLTAGP